MALKLDVLLFSHVVFVRLVLRQHLLTECKHSFSHVVLQSRDYHRVSKLPTMKRIFISMQWFPKNE